MEEFFIIVILGGIFALGAAIGSANTTNDISSKQIIEATTLCQNSEGLYKMNSGKNYPVAYCKNNDKFDLKENKS